MKMSDAYRASKGLFILRPTVNCEPSINREYKKVRVTRKAPGSNTIPSNNLFSNVFS